MGAFMNVRINASGYQDAAFVKTVIEKGKHIENQAIHEEAEIMAIVNQKIGI
jgi:glutamate formiminotransferase/formiminotetrahydrofolate cyclodeaminase